MSPEGAEGLRARHDALMALLRAARGKPVEPERNELYYARHPEKHPTAHGRRWFALRRFEMLAGELQADAADAARRYADAERHPERRPVGQADYLARVGGDAWLRVARFQEDARQLGQRLRDDPVAGELSEAGAVVVELATRELEAAGVRR